MTKLFKGFALVAAFVFSMGAAAQTKIAVVDMQAAMQNTQHFKTALESLEATQNMKTFRAELKTIEGDLKAMDERQKKEASTWSQEQAQQFQQQWQYKRQQFESVARNIQGAMQREVGKLQQKMAPHIQQGVQDIVTAQAIDVLLQRNAVLIAGPQFDITPQLTEKLNAAKLAN